MLWLPRLFGKKCVATIHGLDWQRAKWGAFASEYIKFGEKIAAKYADKIVPILQKIIDNNHLTTYIEPFFDKTLSPDVKYSLYNEIANGNT